MVYEERNTWATLIATVITVPIYIIIVLQQADGGPLTDVDWVPIMLWTMGGIDRRRDRDQHRVGDPRGDARSERGGQVRPARPRHRALRRPRRLRGARRRRPRRARPVDGSRPTGSGSATRSSSASRSRRSSATSRGSSPTAGDSPDGQADEGHQLHPAAARAGGAHAGRARQAHRRDPPDAHRDRAGQVLADARARVPDLARLRRRASTTCSSTRDGPTAGA